MKPTVSVVIPTQERVELFRALESVRAQTVPCHEVLIVVDKEDVSDELNSFLRSNETAIATGGGRGGAGARNIGLDQANGDYVAFLDDDDWWEPLKIAAQLDECRNRGAKLSWTATQFHSGSDIRIIPTRPYCGDEFVGDYLVSRPNVRHGDGYIQSSSLLVDRVLALQSRWDESLKKHQDWDFVIRLIDVVESSYAYIPEPLVHVQQASSNSISVGRKWEASARFLSKYENRWDVRAKSDFILTQIVRSSLASGDFVGIRYSFRALSHGRPHVSAVIVGLFGAVEFAQSRFKGLLKRASKG